MDFIKGCNVRIYVKTTQMTGKGKVLFRESSCKALKSRDIVKDPIACTNARYGTYQSFSLYHYSHIAATNGLPV